MEKKIDMTTVMNYYRRMKRTRDGSVGSGAKRVCLFLVLGWLAGGVGSVPLLRADIYKYVDREGAVHLTNVPSEVNARYILLMREHPVHFRIGTDITRYDTLIAKYAGKYRVDSALVKAVIKAESNFNDQAVSAVGAKGLMQLMPHTASSLQVQDSFHPGKNIEGGVRYLRYLLDRYQGNITLALAAYNAGEGTVTKYENSIPPYRETRRYIQRVLGYLDQYRKHAR